MWRFEINKVRRSKHQWKLVGTEFFSVFQNLQASLQLFQGSFLQAAVARAQACVTPCESESALSQGRARNTPVCGNTET